MKLDDIKARSPFPWRYVTHPNGFVQMFDAAGSEVPLFVLLDLAVLITSAQQKPKEQKEV
ncbi:hypothetical protein [Methyloversatilis sp.]|uniref:hypothetical protein n=1 Tax=Methyloversatilis sp. TaxID=2569862 RepID=UPI0035B1F018